MFRVYRIDFAPAPRDFPNQASSSKFSCLISTPTEALAWAVAKAEWHDKKNKTVIISPEGVPIGGF